MYTSNLHSKTSRKVEIFFALLSRNISLTLLTVIHHKQDTRNVESYQVREYCPGNISKGAF